MQMGLTMRLGIFDPLLQNILRLLNILSVEINRIRWNPSWGIILTEDKLGCLAIILLHLATVSFPLFGELLCERAISILVCLSRLFPQFELDVP